MVNGCTGLGGTRQHSTWDPSLTSQIVCWQQTPTAPWSLLLVRPLIFQKANRRAKQFFFFFNILLSSLKANFQDESLSEPPQNPAQSRGEKGGSRQTQCLMREEKEIQSWRPKKPCLECPPLLGSDSVRSASFSTHREGNSLRDY